MVRISPEAVKSITQGHAARVQQSENTDGLEGEIAKALGANPELARVELWKSRLHSRYSSVVRYNLDSLSDLKRNGHPQELGGRIDGFVARTPRR